MDPHPRPDPTSSFLSLILQSQQDLRNYLFSLHPHAQDLDDLFQETSLKIWQTFGEYDSTRPFLPWALRIAYFQVLRLRKSRSRDRLIFSDDLVEILAGEAPDTPQADLVRSSLNHCLEKLTPRAREVLLTRYSANTNLAALAKNSKESIHSLYRILNSARSKMVTCIRKQLVIEGILPANPDLSR